MKQRFAGVTVFGALFIVVGLLFFLKCFSKTSIVYRMAPIAMGMGASHVVTGIGLLRRKGWSRWFAILLALLTLLLGTSMLADVVIEKLTPPLGWSLRVVWGMVVLWYFLRPGVKAQFGRAAISGK